MKKNIVIVIGVIVVILIAAFALSFKKGSGSSSVIHKNSISVLLSQAKDLESKANFIEAKDKYQELVNNYSGSSEIMNWQKKIDDINIKLLFSSTITPNSQIYEIKPGDTLAKIARQFKTTPELIVKCNKISGDKIFPGKKIKVWTAPFNIVVDKSQNILMLKTGDELIKTYTVSTGTNNSTPVGTFKIVDKIINPSWFKPGAATPIPAGSPDNALGTRWLAISMPSYGIHGTNEPATLGKQATQGCVRMLNSDVEELYIIVPKETEVTIVD